MKGYSISYYLSFIRDSLQAAHESVNSVIANGDAHNSLGRGAYGDVTYQVDSEAEKAIFDVAQKYFESPNIISEEAGVKKGSDIYILVDPIDGSTNAMRGSGLYSTSIAVSESNTFSGIRVAGVIDHTTGRKIWGDTKFVYEDWHLVAPSQVKDLQDAIISFDSKFYMLEERQLRSVARLMHSIKYPRVYSTAALETAYIASGRLDAYICNAGKLRSFDCFPSLFLLKVQGCPFSLDFDQLENTELDTKKRFGYFAAGNAELYRKIEEKVYSAHMI